MPNFRLVNPVVLGTVENTFTSSSPSSAAKQAWSALSKYMENNNPKFAITIQNMSGGQLHHFLVKEKVNGKSVDFTINSIDLNLSTKQSSFMVKNANKLYNQKGGKDKHKKSSDDSSDSDSEESESAYEQIKSLKKKYGSTPISYWWYYPYIYGTSDVVTSVYVPSFNLPYYPVMQLYLPTVNSAFFG
jgi:hypothetical protein